MKIRRIDNTDVAVAARIVAIQRAAYAIEAELMAFDGIPPLHESVSDVQAHKQIVWWGAFEGGQLVGVIAWLDHGHSIEIDRLAVDPAWSRRGCGRELVRAVPLSGLVEVSTGSANHPAIALYEGEDFTFVGTTEVAPGVFTTQFERRAADTRQPASFESVSTWKQPTPPPASKKRQSLLEDTARRIVGLSPWRLRVAVDGYTASGKTSFALELASELRKLGRPTLNASFDDFKKPWRDAREKGYDRTSGDGYYRNAPDFVSAVELLLVPSGPEGSGEVVLCAHDPLTGVDHREVTVQAPPDAILVVDSVFAMRPEYDEFWDYRIWIDVPADLSLARGIARDAASEGKAEATRLHQDRYHVAERIYIDEVDPKAKADLVVDNADFANPSTQYPNVE